MMDAETQYTRDVGKIEVTHDSNRDKIEWVVYESFVTDFIQMASPWARLRGEEYRLLKVIDDGDIYLGLMKRNPSKFVSVVKMGLLTKDSEKKFCVTNVLPDSCFQKERICSLRELTRDFVHVSHVKFFCEVKNSCLPEIFNENSTEDKGTLTLEVKGNSRGTSEEYVDARLKDTDDIRPKEAYNSDREATGIRRKEQGEKELYPRDASEPSGAVQNAGVQENGAERSLPRGTSTLAVEENYGGTSNEYVSARPKDTDYTRPKLEFNSDRAAGGRLPIDLKKLLSEQYQTDTRIITQNGEFRVHLAVIWAREPKLVSKFKDPKDDTIWCLHHKASGFDVFLDFLYGESYDLLSPSNVFDVFPIADEFQVKDLMQECLECIKTCISVENFIDVLKVLLKYDIPDLERLALRFFVKNKEEIIHTEKFLTFSDIYPREINDLFMKESS